ncbi:hypothetical protein [Alicyclobacillus sp.]|uniref:hypothetical protein n=1 Tax=Alicyclobacillus sp. TaxID=61169 RepID=UPI0025B9B29B|nr:hypothetical protein [Alicyclobacillus sp.]MCL6517403.1 hypothetical protein [Alicyclobacillus sp.]
MDVRTYDRLTGWVCLALGVAGWSNRLFSAYMDMTRTEAIIWLCLGVLGVLGARSRRREALFTCCLLWITCLVWTIWGWTARVPWPGTVEPAEHLVRILIFIWGLYTSVQTVLRWLTPPPTQP